MSLRILAVVDAFWQGSNGHAFVRALQRLGHSVQVINSNEYIPTQWRCVETKLLKRVFEPFMVRELNKRIRDEADFFKPALLFVFKGRYIQPLTLKHVRNKNTKAINFYPDVSFFTHGHYLPKALPFYNWVFTTKTFGVEDLNKAIGVKTASFLPHGYDPEIHKPVILGMQDRSDYECDVSFIGAWSPKKQALLEQLKTQMPDIKLLVWGSLWERKSKILRENICAVTVTGLEYSKAVCGSKINLGLLSEKRKGSSHGDQITSRTFQIPAIGGFMLHERTKEFLSYYNEDIECGCFMTGTELVQKTAYYLKFIQKRNEAAQAGYRRAIQGGYSVDCLARNVLLKYEELEAVF